MRTTNLSDTRPSNARSERRLARASAVLAVVAGLGFGAPGVYATWYFASRGRVWMFLGFQTYGGGPFDEIGIHTTVLLLAAFAIVCGAELLLGWMLWQQRRGAVVFALALLPFEFAFWIGFALPFGSVCGISRTLLVLLYWFALRRRARSPEPSPLTPT